MRRSPRQRGQTLPWRASEEAVHAGSFDAVIGIALRDARGSTIGEGLLDPDAIAEIADELEVVLLLATLRVSPPRSTPPRS